MGEGEGWPVGIGGGGGGGGAETGHPTWHHLIVWDNTHMVMGSECRSAITVRQKIFCFIHHNICDAPAANLGTTIPPGVCSENVTTPPWCHPFLTPVTPTCHQERLFSSASPAEFPAIAMKSAIICEQWKFEYSAPPSQRERVLPTTLGRVKTSLGQRQPCPRARLSPASGLKPRCPAGLIGLTDHRSADRYPHPSRQSRTPFHHVPYQPHPRIPSA